MTIDQETSLTIKQDARYKVAIEWCGNWALQAVAPAPSGSTYVARFFGEAIAFCASPSDAWKACADYQNERMLPYQEA